MLRVSKVEGRRNRPRDTEPARPDLRTQGDGVIIRSSGYHPGGQASGTGGSRPPSPLAPIPPQGLPDERAHAYRTGHRPGGQVPGMGGSRPPCPLAPIPLDGPPDEKAREYRAGGEDCRRSDQNQQPGVSGPSSGARALRLHLAMIPPGMRGMPHFHADHETAVYVVSGEAEVWYGTGLVKRSAVHAGDFIYIPPGTPHLAVNRGDVTSIAVVARTDPAHQTAAVVIELPRHLASLLSLPVAVGE